MFLFYLFHPDELVKANWRNSYNTIYKKMELKFILSILLAEFLKKKTKKLNKQNAIAHWLIPFVNLIIDCLCLQLVVVLVLSLLTRKNKLCQGFTRGSSSIFRWEDLNQLTGMMMEEEQLYRVAKPHVSLLCDDTVQLTSWTRPRAKGLFSLYSDWSLVNWPLWSSHPTPYPSPRRHQLRSKVKSPFVSFSFCKVKKKKKTVSKMLKRYEI